MKKLELEFSVTCPKCNNNICIKYVEDVKIMPVGYKGDYKFYVYCKKCGCPVTIEKEVIPQKAVRKIKLGMYF